MTKNSQGETMLDVVVGGLLQKKGDPRFKFGAICWREIKDQFRRHTDPQLALQAPCPPEPIPPELLKAVIACKGHHPDKSLLQCFLATSACRIRRPCVASSSLLSACTLE